MNDDSDLIEDSPPEMVKKRVLEVEESKNKKAKNGK